MKPAITLKQYESIYRIVASIGNHFSHGAGRSCQFYNVNGAFILEQLLKVKARPVMGAAFIRLNEAGDTISFASEENGNFYSSPDAFHCWVETPDFVIDFTAPEYREAADRGMNSASSIPRQMFQKEKRSMCAGPYSMSEPGDFFFSENRELTTHLLEKMRASPASQDFVNICCDWYRKYSKKGIKEMSVMNDLGEITPIRLKASSLVSKW
jgi:hypothetical protein